MRVLLAVEQLRRRVPGGIGTYSRGLLQGLGELGEEAPEVVLLASRPPRRGRDPIEGMGFPVASSRLPGPLLTRAWDAGVVTAPRGFDLVHSVSLASPRSPGAPLVATVHDVAWRRYPEAYPPRGRRWHEAALARVLRRADALVVPSTSVADALLGSEAAARRVEVIEEGCDHLPEPDPVAAGELLSRLGVGDGFLLSVGTLEPRKNLERLVEAYSEARKSLPAPWPLVVVGPGGWGGSPPRAAGVTLAGQVGDEILSGLYAAARCVVYVPLSEGFGLPAVEAMRAGAPVVASPLPSTGGAALEVDPQDVSAIAAGIVRVCNDEDLRGQLAESGSRRASQLTWKQAALRHVRTWESVAGSRSRSASPFGGARRLVRRRPTAAPPVSGGDAERVRVSIDVSAVPPAPAGAGRYTLGLVRALCGRDDVALSLVARGDDAARWAGLAPQARIRAVAPSPRPARLLWEQARMPRVLAGLGVDLHHGPHYTMPEMASLPRVVTVHDLTVFDHPEVHERSKVLFFRHAIRAASRRADALICVSESTAARLRSLLSPSAPVYVVHHGIDHERFTPHEPDSGSDAAVLEGLGIRTPFALSLGTVEPRKDLPSLVRAFDLICDAHPGLSLVIAGMSGWGSEAMGRAVESARHGGRVVRTGYVADDAVPALLRSAAAVAYPAIEEGFGLPALEALACGAPLVTTAGSAMEEVAGNAALLVPPGDTEALAGALDMLVRRDEGLEARRERGLEAAAPYTWEACAAGHTEVYRSVARRRRAR